MRVAAFEAIIMLCVVATSSSAISSVRTSVATCTTRASASLSRASISSDTWSTLRTLPSRATTRARTAACAAKRTD